MLGACSFCSWHTSSVPWLMADVTDFCCCCLSRDIFTAWVAARGGGSTYPVKWNPPVTRWCIFAGLPTCPLTHSAAVLPQCNPAWAAHTCLHVHTLVSFHSAWLPASFPLTDRIGDTPFGPRHDKQPSSTVRAMAWQLQQFLVGETVEVQVCKPYQGLLTVAVFDWRHCCRPRSINHTRVWRWQFLVGDTVQVQVHKPYWGLTVAVLGWRHCSSPSP